MNAIVEAFVEEKPIRFGVDGGECLLVLPRSILMSSPQVCSNGRWSELSIGMVSHEKR